MASGHEWNVNKPMSIPKKTLFYVSIVTWASVKTADSKMAAHWVYVSYLAIPNFFFGKPEDSDEIYFLKFTSFVHNFCSRV